MGIKSDGSSSDTSCKYRYTKEDIDCEYRYSQEDIDLLMGLVINKKRTYRVYREENLQDRTKKRKKLQRPRLVTETPSRVNERWSMDFVYDQLASGRRFRELNVIDDFNRELVGQLTAFSISELQVTRFHHNWNSYVAYLNKLFVIMAQSLRARLCSSGQRKSRQAGILNGYVHRSKHIDFNDIFLAQGRG